MLSHDPRGWRGPKRLLELCRLPPEDEVTFGRFVPAFDYLVDDLARVSYLELLTERELEPEARLILWVLREGRGGEGILAFPDAFFGLLQQIAERHTHLDLVDATFLYLRIVSPGSATADLAALARTATHKAPEGARIAMNSFQKLYEPVVKKACKPVVKKACKPVVKKACKPVVKKAWRPGSSAARRTHFASFSRRASGH